MNGISEPGSALDLGERIARLELLYGPMRDRISVFEAEVRGDLGRSNGKLDQLLLRDSRRAGSFDVLAQLWRAFAVPAIAATIWLAGYPLRPFLDRLLHMSLSSCICLQPSGRGLSPP